MINIKEYIDLKNTIYNSNLKLKLKIKGMRIIDNIIINLSKINNIIEDSLSTSEEIIYTGKVNFVYFNNDYQKPMLNIHNNHYLFITKSYVISDWSYRFNIIPNHYSKITCELIDKNEDLTKKWLVATKDDGQPVLCYNKNNYVCVDDKGQTLLEKENYSKYKLKFHI
jgi:hypothetical protein